MNIINNIQDLETLLRLLQTYQVNTFETQDLKLTLTLVKPQVVDAPIHHSDEDFETQFLKMSTEEQKEAFHNMLRGN
jgi:hypothetical protein